MTKLPTDVFEACERIKRMGYSPGNHIHIYGEKLEVISDPFPEGTGIALRVKHLRDGHTSVIQLPVTLWQSAQKRIA